VALVHQGKYAEALAIFERIPSDINPSLWHYHVAWALLHLDRDEEASTLIERYLREHPDDRGGLLTSARTFLRSKSGDVRGAEEDIRKAEEIGKGFIHFHHTASRIAAAYALLHQPGPAVQWLRRAAEDGLPCYPCFAKDPTSTIFAAIPPSLRSCGS
jgi:tetratricopeptide (TPR) repeat protein